MRQERVLDSILELLDQSLETRDVLCCHLRHIRIVRPREFAVLDELLPSFGERFPVVDESFRPIVFLRELLSLLWIIVKALLRHRRFQLGNAEPLHFDEIAVVQNGLKVRGWLAEFS